MTGYQTLQFAENVRKKRISKSNQCFNRQGKMGNIKFGKSGPFFFYIFCEYLTSCMWPSLFMICRILSREDTAIMGSPQIRVQGIDSFEILVFSLFVTHLFITYLVIAICKYLLKGLQMGSLLILEKSYQLTIHICTI